MAMAYTLNLTMYIATFLQVHILTDNISDPWIRAISDRGMYMRENVRSMIIQALIRLALDS